MNKNECAIILKHNKRLADVRHHQQSARTRQSATRDERRKGTLTLSSRRIELRTPGTIAFIAAAQRNTTHVMDANGRDVRARLCLDGTTRSGSATFRSTRTVKSDVISTARLQRGKGESRRRANVLVSPRLTVAARTRHAGE